MKDTFYFSHDYNARSDEKIIKLISKEGWTGYGLYWAIVEKLYEAGGFLDNDVECIAYELRTECERITNVLQSGLFEFRMKKFYSKSVLARLQARKGKSELARQSAFLRWGKPKSNNANAMRTQCERNANKVKKSKVKKITVINKLIPEGLPLWAQSGITTEPSKKREDIDWLLEEFGKTMGFKSAGSKDRFMANHLLNNFTQEQLSAMLQFCATQEFAPRIGSVEKLWYKRGDIIAGIKSMSIKNNNSPKITKL